MCEPIIIEDKGVTCGTVRRLIENIGKSNIVLNEGYDKQATFNKYHIVCLCPINLKQTFDNVGYNIERDEGRLIARRKGH